MSLESIDLAVAPILAELKVNQDAAFAKNKKYAQLYKSHDDVPTEATDVKVALVKDEDITPTLPAKLDFAFRVDEIQFPGDSKGWVLWVWAKEAGETYVKAWTNNCSDAHVYPKDWTLTADGP